LLAYFDGFYLVSEPFFRLLSLQAKKLTPLNKPQPSNTPRVMIDLALGTPFLILPQSPESPDHLLVDLGTVSLTTELTPTSFGYHISLNDFHIQTIFCSTGDKREVKLMEKTQFTLAISIPDAQHNLKHLLPDVTIKITASNIKFVLTREQLILPALLLTNNFLSASASSQDTGNR